LATSAIAKSLATGARRGHSVSVLRRVLHGPGRSEFPRPLGSARHIWVLLVGALLLVAAGVVIVHVREHHAGGDPGGRIMAVLTNAEVAIPPGAEIAYRHDEGPHWDSCDGRDGTYGWDDVVFQVHFSSTLSASEIVAGADGALLAKGWSRSGLADGPTQWIWGTQQRSVGAQAQLTRDPDGKWTLYATAPPVGRRASGC
jgi:hypothetical protein